MAGTIVLDESYRGIIVRGISLLHTNLEAELEVLKLMLKDKYVNDILFCKVHPSVNCTRDEIEDRMSQVKLQLSIIDNIAIDLGA